MNKNAGVALVIVIWVLSFLTLMAASFALTIRRETAVTTNARDSAIVEALAESGVNVAQKMLLKNKADEKWWPDGAIYQFKLDNAQIRVKILAESGKISLNGADEALLMKVLAHTDLDAEKQAAIVGAILDWRDGDNLVRINGAEKEQYLQAGLSYGPANRPFETLEELQRVLGMNMQLYQQLKPLLTVYHASSAVDLQMADKAVLEIMSGLDETSILNYIKQRISHHRQGQPAPALPTGQSAAGSAAGNGNNAVYQVISQVSTETGLKAAYSAVIQKNQSPNKPFRWLAWQRLYDYSSFFEPEMDEWIIDSCCLAQ